MKHTFRLVLAWRALIVVKLMPAVNNIAGDNIEVSTGFKGRTCGAKWWW
jgi:hypothetical protein